MLSLAKSNVFSKASKKREIRTNQLNASGIYGRKIHSAIILLEMRIFSDVTEQLKPNFVR